MAGDEDSAGDARSPKEKLEARRFLIATGVAVLGIIVALPPAVDWLRGPPKPEPVPVRVELPRPADAHAAEGAPATPQALPFEKQPVEPLPNNRWVKTEKPRDAASQTTPPPQMATSDSASAEDIVCQLSGDCGGPGNHRTGSGRTTAFGITRTPGNPISGWHPPLSADQRGNLLTTLVKHDSARDRTALSRETDARLLEMWRADQRPRAIPSKSRDSTF